MRESLDKVDRAGPSTSILLVSCFAWLHGAAGVGYVMVRKGEVDKSSLRGAARAFFHRYFFYTSSVPLRERTRGGDLSRRSEAHDFESLLHTSVSGASPFMRRIVRTLKHADSLVTHTHPCYSVFFV